MTAPAAGATVRGTVAVTATATDDVGVAGVQFRLDGADLGAEDTSAPYSVNWDTTAAAAGAHTLSAIARDAAGNTTHRRDGHRDGRQQRAARARARWRRTRSRTAPGTTLTDATGKGHTGTIREATLDDRPAATAARCSSTASTTGSRSRTPPTCDLTTAMTLEAWVNPTENAGWRTAMMKERAGDLAYALYSGGATAPQPSDHHRPAATATARATGRLGARAEHVDAPRGHV